MEQHEIEARLLALSERDPKAFEAICHAIADGVEQAAWRLLDDESKRLAKAALLSMLPGLSGDPVALMSELAPQSIAARRAFDDALPEILANVFPAAERARAIRARQKRGGLKGASRNERNLQTAAENKRAVLRAAQSEGATIAGVARELGMSPNTVRRYWPKKN